MNFLAFLQELAARFATWADLDFWEAMFACTCGFFAVVMYRLHRSSSDPLFRFSFFWADDVTGKPSLRKLLAFGAFLVHSWATARYCAYTPLDDTVISLLALYGLLWAGVLMLGNVLNTLADAIAAKFGVRQPPPAP